MNIDKAKHTAEGLIGKAKEAVGSATGNDSLAADGRAEQATAKATKLGDDVKDALGG